MGRLSGFCGPRTGPPTFRFRGHRPVVLQDDVDRGDLGYAVEAGVDDAPREAFFGARPCEVAALDVLGGVLDIERAAPLHGSDALDLVVVARQLEKTSIHFYGQSGAMRASDHQFQQPLEVAVSETS